MAESTKHVYFNEQLLLERIAKEVAAYWNGKPVPVTGGVGSEWSDWRDSITGSGQRVRVPGTKKRISAVNGTIRATANGSTVTIEVLYTVVIESAPDDWKSDVTEVPEEGGQ